LNQGFDIQKILSVLASYHKQDTKQFNSHLLALMYFYMLNGTNVVYKSRNTKTLSLAGVKRIKAALVFFKIDKDTKPDSSEQLTLGRIIAALPNAAIELRTRLNYEDKIRPSAGVLFDMISPHIDNAVFCSPEGCYMIPTDCPNLFKCWLVWNAFFHKVTARKNKAQFSPSVLRTKWEQTMVSQEARNKYWLDTKMKDYVGYDTPYAFEEYLKNTIITQVGFDYMEGKTAAEIAAATKSYTPAKARGEPTVRGRKLAKDGETPAELEKTAGEDDEDEE
jgi:hypothetical protein